MVLTVDATIFLARLRDREAEDCKNAKVAELRKVAKHHGLKCKTTTKKADVIDMLVRFACGFLSFTHQPTIQSMCSRACSMFKKISMCCSTY